MFLKFRFQNNVRQVIKKYEERGPQTTASPSGPLTVNTIIYQKAMMPSRSLCNRFKRF